MVVFQDWILRLNVYAFRSDSEVRKVSMVEILHDNMYKNISKDGTVVYESYDTVWYGMAWHGMVWCGVVWYGMVSYRMVCMLCMFCMLCLSCIYVRMYACMHACMHECMYVCMHVCMYECNVML